MDNLVLNKLFTQSVFKDLIMYSRNSTYDSVIKKFTKENELKNNEGLIQEVYNYMSKQYRNEYFYQNTLLNKLLLGKHSVTTTTALTQLTINKSKADFILINGKAVVYEIKTELDNFERLSSQLADYYKGFNHVCVVTSVKNYSKLEALLKDSPVGIYVLTKSNTISATLKKEPIEENRHLNYSSIFKVMRKSEFESVLRKYFSTLPNVPQVFYYDECFSLFSEIPLLKAYELALVELKKRNQIGKEDLEKVPYALRSLIYFSKSKLKDMNALNYFLDETYRR